MHNSSRTMEIHIRAAGCSISVNHSCRLRTGERDRRQVCGTSSSRPGTHETQACLALASIARSEQSNASGQYGPFPSHSKSGPWHALLWCGTELVYCIFAASRTGQCIQSRHTRHHVESGTSFVHSRVLQIECASVSTTWTKRRH